MRGTDTSAAKSGDHALVRAMLLQLVTSRGQWLAYAFAHYGVLIKATT